MKMSPSRDEIKRRVLFPFLSLLPEQRGSCDERERVIPTLKILPFVGFSFDRPLLVFTAIRRCD